MTATILDPATTDKYRVKVLAYYITLQEYRDPEFARKQVVNLPQSVLVKEYEKAMKEIPEV